MTGKQSKVLVVEDEALIRLQIVDALEDAGYAVIEAGNVLEAVAILGLHADIAAVFTDIDMPGGLNGLDLARLVGAYDPQICLLVTSGGRTLSDDDLPGGGRFLQKPYRTADVISALDDRLGQGAAPITIVESRAARV